MCLIIQSINQYIDSKCCLVLVGSSRRSSWCSEQGRIRIKLGPIQRMIGLAKARLLRYLKEAAPLLSVPVEEKKIVEQEFQIEELIKCMNTNI